MLGLLIHPAAAAGSAWLRWRRGYYRHRSRTLSGHELAGLSGFFSPGLLESVRIAHIARISNPPVPRFIRRCALPGMLDLGTVSGMAFIDTVVISSRNGPNTIPGVDSVPPGLPLLFHELVHVAQYRALGVRGFVREYLNGWLAGGRDYFAIPLERQAFELQRRFEREPSAHFRVESEIAGTWTGGVC